jgi:DUF1365 family protein
MKKESFEEFQERIGIKADNDNVNLNLSILFFLSSIYCYEQKLNWRRQIVKIKKTLDSKEKNVMKHEKCNCEPIKIKDVKEKFISPWCWKCDMPRNYI